MFKLAINHEKLIMSAPVLVLHDNCSQTAERSCCLSGFIYQCRTASRELAVSTVREVQGSNIEMENGYFEIVRYFLGLFNHGNFF
jgi:hypothetical protein